MILDFVWFWAPVSGSVVPSLTIITRITVVPASALAMAPGRHGYGFSHYLALKTYLYICAAFYRAEPLKHSVILLHAINPGRMIWLLTYTIQFVSWRLTMIVKRQYEPLSTNINQCSPVLLPIIRYILSTMINHQTLTINSIDIYVFSTTLPCKCCPRLAQYLLRNHPTHISDHRDAMCSGSYWVWECEHEAVIMVLLQPCQVMSRDESGKLSK